MPTRKKFGVERICRALRDHNVPIAPSTYYAAKKRPPSARQRSDERLLEVIERVHRENFGVYGVRTVWHALQHEGVEIGRDQVARPMRLAGLKGQTRRKKIRTTFQAPGAMRLPDLVRRDWFQDAPDRVWVADFTNVFTREGWVYASFVQDGFCRRILGFTVSSRKSSERVLFNSELIHARQTGWISRQEVETATTRWVTWFNRRRLHSSLDYVGPLDFEAVYTQAQVLLRQAA